MLLEVNDVSKSFGGVQAVRDVSIQVDNHQIVSMIGPNGAGKTTLFNTISGIYKPDHGEIHFSGENITGKNLNTITQRGIARTFQNIRLFKGLSVLENIMTSCDPYSGYTFFQAVLNTKKKRKIDKENRELCMNYLHLVGLQGLYKEKPENLPYGMQRKLELARALATKPKLLLLDEPAAGLNSKEAADFIELILKIFNEMNLSIFIIEHRMQIVNELSKWIYVLNFGKLLAQGTSADIQNNPEVIKAYIGEED
jgi:branched-chain amino acid transport system ATP-binding protein